MIAYLHGKVINKNEKSIIIDVNGVGYKVLASAGLLKKANLGEDFDLYVYQQITQGQHQTISLYGVENLDELDFFELLLSVSGIGPKTALAVLDTSNIREVKHSILMGDPEVLARTPGIGKKTAERAILDLRNKVGELDFNYQSRYSSASSEDDLNALVALGYSTQQAKEALAKIDEKITDSGERVKLALKNLN